MKARRFYGVVAALGAVIACAPPAPPAADAADAADTAGDTDSTGDTDATEVSAPHDAAGADASSPFDALRGDDATGLDGVAQGSERELDEGVRGDDALSRDATRMTDAGADTAPSLDARSDARADRDTPRPDGSIETGAETSAPAACGNRVCEAGETCASCRDCCREVGAFRATSNTTYRGLHVTSASGPCIDLGATTGVRIEDSEIGPCDGVGVYGFGATNVTLTRSYLHDVASGAELANSTGGGIVIERNVMRNVRGPRPRAQYVQLNGVHGPGIAICCNVVEQDPLMGGEKEDSFSFFDSSGTAASPIVLAYNKMRGGNGSSGCGVVLGDLDGAYIDVHHNVVIQTGACGIGVAGGHDMRVADNLVYSPATALTQAGIVVWDQYMTACHAVTVARNQVNWSFVPRSTGVPEPNPLFNAGNCGAVSDLATNNWAAPIDARIWETHFAECD